MEYGDGVQGRWSVGIEDEHQDETGTLRFGSCCAGRWARSGTRTRNHIEDR